MIASPSGAGARACAPSVRGITIRKIPKVNAVLKRVGKAGRVRAIGTGTGTPESPESPVSLVLGGGNPELVELIMGLIEADPDKDPKEAQEQAMRGVLSWASLNRANRALFHRTHLKWWPALLTKHAHVADPERLGRSVVPHTTGTAMHARFVQIHDNLVREREEREEREAKAKAEAAAAMAQWEAERGISIRRAQEHADHFENTDQYQRWMFHTSKRDPRELELTKVMQRAERLVDHPKHQEDKSQSKELNDDKRNDTLINVNQLNFLWRNTFEIENRKSDGWREKGSLKANSHQNTEPNRICLCSGSQKAFLPFIHRWINKLKIECTNRRQNKR